MSSLMAFHKASGLLSQESNTLLKTQSNASKSNGSVTYSTGCSLVASGQAAAFMDPLASAMREAAPSDMLKLRLHIITYNMANTSPVRSGFTMRFCNEDLQQGFAVRVFVMKARSCT
jgi:hypothetical protein